MAVQARKRELSRELAQSGFNTSFAGRWISDYRCPQLSDLIRLFFLGQIPRSPSKYELCVILLEGKPHLNPGETNAAQAIFDGHTLVYAQGILIQSGATPAAPGPTFTNATSQPQLVQGAAEGASRSQTHPTRTCSTCFEDVALSAMPAKQADSQCSHSDSSLCTTCLAEYIISQASSSSLDSILCPEANCTAVLSYETMRLYAPPHLFDRYTNIINFRVIAEAGDYVECSNAACTSGGLVDNSTMTFMTCNECSQSTCISCKTPWHPDRSHEQNLAEVQAAQQQRDQQAAQQDQRTAQYIQRYVKPCPSCGVAISKNHGCDHMTW